MDTLRAWTQIGGVDGFRFDLAVTLARRREGYDAFAPLLAAIEQDPVLRPLKLIAEPWDVGPGGYQVGKFPPRWSEWNDAFRDDLRKFWRGDGGMISALATRLAGSQPIFGKFGRPTKSVNFITAHDGFTLADLVAYRRKRNEANGEHNRDGTDANHSWNNGVEGPTQDEQILALRRRDQRNLLATLFSARGLPMLAMGSESGHSQNGNNNAYAQDNLLTWIDWGTADTKLIAFTKKLIALRLGEAALHSDAFLTGAPLNDGSIPDAQWFAAEGATMRDEQWREHERRFLGLSLHAEDSRALILLNAGGPVNFPLTTPRAGKRWRLAIDTFADETAERFFGADESLPVETRSVKILVEAAKNHRRA
jgi:glycogen operon protein